MNTITPKKYVIVGAGIAGVSAAEAIHKSDPQAEITLISNEDSLPYFRMNLTRYLAGEVEAKALDLHIPAWYPENHVDLRLNSSAVDILPQEKTLLLSDGSRLQYDLLILTAGAHPFVPPIPGADLAGVQTVRTIHDADCVLDVCRRHARVVCIGGGLLGLEVAGAIARHGAEVTVLESLSWLLPRQLDQRASQILQSKIEAMGIAVRAAVKTQALLGTDKVTGVQLSGGEVLPADMVVISAGVVPNLDLARKAGLQVNRGVIVDDSMRTSDPAILAAGDIAEHNGRVYGLWVPAKKQGEIAGLNAAGKPASFGGDAPSARLKVLGIDLFSIGQFSPEEGDLHLAEEKDSNYISFVLRGGVMIGAILLGDASLAAKVKAAVDSGRNFGTELGQNLTLEGILQALKQ